MADNSTILPSALDQYRAASGANGTSTTKKSELGQQAFLDLMVTQLKNQDPMNPLQGADMLGQMAQFSTVTGINSLQSSFSSLASSLQSNQALQASTMVGRSVVVPRDRFAFAAGGSAALAATLPGAASNVTVSITDANGQLVRHQQLGPQPAGTVDYNWDGKRDDGKTAAGGNYTIKFDGIVDGQSTALTAAVRARVDSVSLGRNGLPPQLNVDGLGAVALSDVIEIQ